MVICGGVRLWPCAYIYATTAAAVPFTLCILVCMLVFAAFAVPHLHMVLQQATIMARLAEYQVQVQDQQQLWGSA